MTPSERSEVDLPDIAAEPPWYKIAVAEYDLHKTIQHTADGDQRIHEYFQATSYHPAEGTSASWCAAFVNWCLKRAGVAGDNNAGAANFKDWGIELSKPRPGCIMVIHWEHYAKGDSGNHVTFFHHDAGNQLYYFGGNQTERIGHMVKHHRLVLGHASKSAFADISYRWPK